MTQCIKNLQGKNHNCDISQARHIAPNYESYPQKDWGTFWAKIVKNYHILGQQEKNEKKKLFFQNSTIQICTRLLREHVEKNLETLTTQIKRL